MAELAAALPSPLLKIRQFARLAQVSVRTVRFYDQRGLLPAAWVDPWNGYRYYTLEQLDRLRAILMLKRFGCSLDEIATLLHAATTPSQRLTALLRKRSVVQQALAEQQRHLAELDAHIHHLTEEHPMPEPSVVIKTIAALHVATIETSIGLDEPLEMLTPALRRLPQSELPCLAVWADQDRDIGETHMRVLLAAPVSSATVLSPVAQLHDLPGVSLAACTLHRGAARSLGQSYARLHHWCADQGYRVTGPSRTVFLRALNAGVDGDLELEVQLPVAPENRLASVEPIIGATDLPRWSERARQVVAVAVADGPPVTTHRLLVALLGIPKGFASHVLRQLGASNHTIGRLTAPTTTDEVLLPDGMWTVPARAVLEGAVAEANARGHAHVGTEHLLLSLLQQPSSAAARALDAAGLGPDAVRGAIEKQLQTHS